MINCLQFYWIIIIDDEIQISSQNELVSRCWLIVLFDLLAIRWKLGWVAVHGTRNCFWNTWDIKEHDWNWNIPQEDFLLISRCSTFNFVPLFVYKTRKLFHEPSFILPAYHFRFRNQAKPIKLRLNKWNSCQRYVWRFSRRLTSLFSFTNPIQ